MIVAPAALTLTAPKGKPPTESSDEIREGLPYAQLACPQIAEIVPNRHFDLAFLSLAQSGDGECIGFAHLPSCINVAYPCASMQFAGKPVREQRTSADSIQTTQSLRPAGHTRTDFLNAQLGFALARIVELVPLQDFDLGSLSFIRSWACHGRFTTVVWIILVCPFACMWLLGQFARTQAVSTASMQRQEDSHLYQATARASWSASATSAWTGAHGLATAMVAPQESFLPWSRFLQSFFASLKLIRQLLLLSTTVKACPWPSGFFVCRQYVGDVAVTGDWGPCHFCPACAEDWTVLQVFTYFGYAFGLDT
eukprot:s1362_g10.t1